MPKRYRPTEVVRVLEHLGWTRRRGRGDHIVLTRVGHRTNIAIDTGARIVPAGTFGSILRSAGLRRDEFERVADEVL